MLVFFLAAAGAALLSIHRPELTSPAWALAFVPFAVPLLAAIATNRRFRSDAPLLGAHLSLLAIVFLVAWSRLDYVDGAVTLSQGEVFEGKLHVDRRGMMHGDDRLRFSHEGFAEVLHTRDRWRSTASFVRWFDANGGSRMLTLGHDEPLVADGYRVYPTFNRGLLPVFEWRDGSGAVELGGVQLRASDDAEFGMANEWVLPNGQTAWVLIRLSEDPRPARGETRFNLAADRIAHELVLRVGEERHILALGDEIRLGAAAIRYVDLQTWMGFRIVYDPAAHWTLAAALLFVGCLVSYYWRSVLRLPRRAPVAAEKHGAIVETGS
jgi:hypothetical protein